jgi:hypothetical protein
MEIKINTKDLQKALNQLDESVKSYCTIQSTYENSNRISNREFQKHFNSFYKIRRSEDWQKIYYKYFEKALKGERLQFHDLLIALHKQTGNIEASYCSKLIATIDPSKPIIDKYVLKNIGAKLPYNASKDRIKKICDLYEEMYKKYSEYLETDPGKHLVSEFKKRFSKYKINKIKMLDFILWKMR